MRLASAWPGNSDDASAATEIVSSVNWVIQDMLLHSKDVIRPGRGVLLAAVGLAIGISVQNAARADEVAAPGSQQISLDDLSETRNRPLFSPSRRPRPANVEVAVTAPPPPPPPQEPVPAPNLTFLGTFESPTEVGATVQIPSNDKPITIRYGTYINGWRVVDISHKRLVLAHEDRRVVFTLFNPSAANGETPGAPPPTGPQFHPPPTIVPAPGPRTAR
jgi:hypothetical protein